MRYLLFVIVAFLVLGCQKSKEEKDPCPYLVNASGPAETIYLISIIDPDSVNLLANNAVDILDITISDSRGTTYKVQPWFSDASHNQVKYIGLPFAKREGVTNFSIKIGSKTVLLNYNYKIDRQNCYIIYSAFGLNGLSYTFKPGASEYLYTNFNGENRHRSGSPRILYIIP